MREKMLNTNLKGKIIFFIANKKISVKRHTSLFVSKQISE